MRYASQPIPKGRLSSAILLVLAFAAAAGCGRKERAPAAEEGGGAARSAVPVVVQALQPTNFQIAVDISGSTEAGQEVNISAEVGGTVTDFPHELGDTLAAGELILQVDARPYRAGVKQAKAGVLAAESAYLQTQRELERARQLMEKGRISDAEFEGVELRKLQAESGFYAAQATLEQAQIRLEHAEIRAPFAGRLAYKGIDEGEQIAPGMPVTAVIDLSGIVIRSSVSERDAVRIREGMDVDVSIPALGEEHFRGRVRALGVRSNPMTRSFDIEIEVDNESERILSGMAARGAVVVDRRLGALTIPTSAVVDQYGEPVVFVVTENQAERRPIELGLRSGDRFVVKDGLEFGERLIVKGQWSVKNGTTVEIKD